MKPVPEMPDSGAPASERHIPLADEAATGRLGRIIAGALRPGDTVLLAGPLGVGKSALARAVIRALLGDAEADVPSPSYTLVNVYETPAGEVWHADLYRLADPASELAELGLDEALGAAIVLIEWADRLAVPPPGRRLEVGLDFAPGGARRARLRLVGGGWEALTQALEETP